MQLRIFETEQVRKEFDAKKRIVNVASVPKRSPFRYPGGKTWFVPTLRKWLGSKTKKPTLLVEPFAGGGIVGLTAAFENLTEKVVLNELDESVAAVWQVLIHGDYEKLARSILTFKMSFETAQEVLEKRPSNTDEKAFQTIVKNRVSHGGIMAPGFGLVKNGENGRGISSRWYPKTLARRITEIGMIRSRLSFRQEDAFKVIEEYIDDTQAVFFIDPPYTAAGKSAGRRLYVHHSLDHKKLFSTFAKSRGDFVFTYDESPELRFLAGEQGFQCRLVPMKNTHHAEMTELVIGRRLEWL